MNVNTRDLMRVVSSRPSAFETFAPGGVGLGRGVTLLHGADGPGKTNILEALYADRRAVPNARRPGDDHVGAAIARRGRDQRRPPRVPLRRRSRERPAAPGEAALDAGRRMASPSGRRFHAGPSGARQGTYRSTLHLDGFVAALRPASQSPAALVFHAVRAATLVSRIAGRRRSGRASMLETCARCLDAVEVMDARAGAVTSRCLRPPPVSSVSTNPSSAMRRG